MINRRKQLPGHAEQRRFHRVQFMPPIDYSEWPTDTQLLVPGREGQQGNGPVTSLPQPQQPGRGQTIGFPDQAAAVEAIATTPLNWRVQGQAGKPLARFADTGDDLDGFANRETISLAVLKGIAVQQGQPVPLMKSEISGAASNASIIGLGTIASYVFRFGTNFLVQRGLGAAFYGMYALGMAVVVLISSVFNLGLDDTMVRYVAIYRSKKQGKLLRSLTIFCSALAGASGILGALLLIAFAPFLATLEHKPAMAPLLQLMAPLIPLMCMQVIWLAGLQGFKEFKKRVLVQRILVPGIVFVLQSIVLLFFRDVISVTIITIVGTLLTTVICLYYFFRVVSRNVEPELGDYELREWLGFAAPNFLTAIVDTVLDAIDTLLLAFFAVPIASIGQYSAALKINSFTAMPLTSLNVTFTPTIAELYHKGEMQKLEAMFKVVTKWSITFSLPLFLISTLFSPSLLGLSGSSFVAGWPLLIALAVGSMVSAATGSVGFMLMMTGHQKFSLLNSIIAVTLNVVLGIILTPLYGAMGTAVSTGMTIIIVNLMRLAEVRFLLKMQPYRLDTLKPLAAGLISAALTGGAIYLLSRTGWSIRILHTHLLPIQLFLIPVFLASYIGLLIVFKISPEDKIVLDKVSKKFKRGAKKSAA